MKANYKEYGRTRRLYKPGRASRFTLKATSNSYYYMVRWAKQKYWEKFLQGVEELQGDLAIDTGKQQRS